MEPLHRHHARFPGVPLSRHVLFESRDREETRHRVAQVFCPHELRVLQADGRVDARQHCVTLGRTSVSYLSYGTAVAIDPVSERSFYLVQVPLRGTARIRTGPAEFGSSVHIASVINPSDPLHMDWSADCAQLIVRFDQTLVNELVAGHLGRALKRELRFEPALDCTRESSRRWLELVRHVVDCVESGPASAPGALAARQLGQAMLALLLEAQPSDVREHLLAPRRSCAPRHVRRAEEYILANVGTPIGVEDIVAASGASMRSLYEGFRRFRGTSPMEFLRTQRLARARTDLLRAGPRTRVSAIAARWGFYQFGRFAAQYRERYGESPSGTLRRTQSSLD